MRKKRALQSFWNLLNSFQHLQQARQHSMLYKPLEHQSSNSASRLGTLKQHHISSSRHSLQVIVKRVPSTELEGSVGSHLIDLLTLDTLSGGCQGESSPRTGTLFVGSSTNRHPVRSPIMLASQQCATPAAIAPGEHGRFTVAQH